MRLVAVLGMCMFGYVLPGCETDEGSGTDGGVDGGTGGTGGTGGAGGTGGGACDEACGSPGDFSGTWTGTYQCTPSPSTCGQPFGGEIDIEVTQEGCSATYSDGTDTFSGSVCGDVFTFDKTAGPPGSTESGTFTLLSSTTAKKESTYVSTDSDCTGDCEDNLSR
jgi:hypothetical protein